MSIFEGRSLLKESNRTGESLSVRGRWAAAQRAHRRRDPSAVLSGEMRPGTRVRQELLASKFGASRIPAREALKQLQNEGLVVLAANRGAWIADVNSAESIEVYKSTRNVRSK